MEKIANSRQKSGVNVKNDKLKGKFKLLFDRIKVLLAGAVFPDDCKCIVCDKEIPKGSKYCLCEDCLKTFPFNNGRICVRCGAPMDNEACYCLECQNYSKHFDFARSSLKYEKDAQRLILELKFHNNRWIARHFADMLYDTYMDNVLDADVVIAVPISFERKKVRGYNQSYLIAKPLADKLNLPLLDDVVIKVKDNKQQTTLSARDRRKNVEGAYKLANRGLVKGKKVLLVDDILTTGSTMSEVARLLKIAGATAVYGITVASPQFKVPSEVAEDYSDFERL